jgi:putative oxidoreductase
VKLVASILAKAERVSKRVQSGSWVPALLVRLFVGYFFTETGWGKVHNLDALTQRFVQWGIPLPAFNAALSGYTELIGGTFILIGLFTRLASIPMLINMVVAVIAVKMKEVGGVNDFVELDEPLYGLTFLWLFFVGPGRVSLDHLIVRLLKGRGSKHEETAVPHAVAQGAKIRGWSRGLGITDAYTK